MTNLEKQLKKINPLNVKYKNTNLTYSQILQQESKRLKDILQKHIEHYYNSYSPVVYQRGLHDGNLLDSLSTDDVCTVSSDGIRFTMAININENAIHKSLIDNSEANAFWLMNDGWQVRKETWFKEVYRFGFYEGAHYVEDAIEEFENTSKYGIKVDVIRPLLYY